MSVLHDFLMTELHDQRSAELRAEADSNRLARIAQADRPVWWRRWLASVAPSPGDPGRRRPATHRVA